MRAAEDDFTEIISYIAAEKPDAAESLIQRIEHSLRLLATNPYLGRVPKDAALLDLGYRYLVVQNYLISIPSKSERSLFNELYMAPEISLRCSNRLGLGQSRNGSPAEADSGNQEVLHCLKS